VIDDQLINELEQSQSLLLALVDDIDAKTFCAQHHPDLSPIGWHLGHCTYNECYWLHEKLRGDDSLTAPIAELYVPPRTPKGERGARLPRQRDLIEWTRELNRFNRHYLQNLRPELLEHPLLRDDYLVHFLIQHNSQHYETMLMVLTQKTLAEHPGDTPARQSLEATSLQADCIGFPAGHYRVGGEPPQAYDNELPVQQTKLDAFSISRQPVSNSEYLGFMLDGGYTDSNHWSDAGRAWCHQNAVSQPDHWRQDETGNWYGVGLHGAFELTANEPVSGLSHHEARAFAHWAGARLPHEYQWEVASRTGALEQTGHAWEWCENAFHPYDGFTPFPYDEYSQPWFDQQHYSLKGGSLYTCPAIRRPSFRNFYQADKRHVFAGLRLAY